MQNGNESGNVSSKRRKRAELTAQALQLRACGYSYRAIGQALGRSTKKAFVLVRSGLEQIVEEPAEAARQLELARLDRLLEAIWPAAMGGDLRAIDRALSVSDRRAKLLGIDQPAQARIEHAGEVAVELSGAMPVKLELVVIRDRQPELEGEQEPVPAGALAAAEQEAG